MPTPSELVTEEFAQAATYIADASAKLTEFTNKLNDAIQLAPMVSVTFDPPTDPGAETVAPYVPPADYTDSLLTTLASTLTTRLAGGTGLAPSVETAIWDRARDREVAIAQAAIDDVTIQAESLGFELPSGVLNDGIRRETRNYYDKVSGLSRDIAVKQAELEQSNMQKGIDQATQYEDMLSQIVTRRSQVAVEAYRADVLRFQAQVEQDVKHWEAQIKLYEATAMYIMEAQKLNTEVTRANLATLLEAAKTGAQVYAQLVASAYSMIHVSAGVSAGASTSVGYSYGGDVSGTVSPLTSI